MLLDVTIQPVMFVLLFAFVFGGVDRRRRRAAGYRAWLLAGIMAQTVAFASFIVAVGLTADLDKGIVDRMRSLPINPAAVLVGRSISSLAHSSHRPRRHVADRSAPSAGGSTPTSSRRRSATSCSWAGASR